jgi:hypothetical protein
VKTLPLQNAAKICQAAKDLLSRLSKPFFCFARRFDFSCKINALLYKKAAKTDQNTIIF